MFSTCFSRCQFDLNQSSQLPIFFDLYSTSVPTSVPTSIRPQFRPQFHSYIHSHSFLSPILLSFIINLHRILRLYPIPLETLRPSYKTCFSCRFSHIFCKPCWNAYRFTYRRLIIGLMQARCFAITHRYKPEILIFGGVFVLTIKLPET